RHVDQRAVGHWHIERQAGDLAFEMRHHLLEHPRCVGIGRNNVFRGGARAAQITRRHVRQPLVVCVSVHGSEKHALDAEALSIMEMIGAAQWAVTEPLEMMRCSALSCWSLTPMTTVMSGSSTGGTHRITRLAPASRCFFSSARLR